MTVPPITCLPSPQRSAVIVALRSALAFILSVLLSPLLVPIFIRLPRCSLTRRVQNISVLIIRFLAYVANVRATIPFRSIKSDNNPSWLPFPLVSEWISPLPNGRHIVTYDQPARWMSEQQLEQLRQCLRYVAEASVQCVPNHALFQSSNALLNRVVSIVFDDEQTLGFCAVLYVPGHRVEDGTMIHLGLTMISRNARKQRLQSSLLSKCLLVPSINLSTLEYYVTNIAASPAGIGSVSDYFNDTFPHYNGSVRRKDHHLRIARHVLANFRHEFGCSRFAKFDESTFVVYASNDARGGGTHEFIRPDGTAVSRYRDDDCDRFVLKFLDLTRGDELFQVATMNVFSSLYSYFSRRLRRR
eukprot:TRINITY_DN516_c0_g1_i1.p1 TRINITY_DN516_c0_g1~~TRINITY_DN516_c0_g1_i1.p1  ORF type:complete len:358 (+),score=45.48 TRINITY_DN516_c0_g1_i1:391-1464(+)